MDQNTLIKQIKKAFPGKFKPQESVDDPMHCLACNETHEAYEEIEDRKHVNPKDFRICYMSVECLSENALKYLMPRLLELVLIEEEDDEDDYLESFIRQVIHELVPKKERPNRFMYYNKEQIMAIIHFLETIKDKASKKEIRLWIDEGDIITADEYNEDLYLNAENGLKFWNEQRKK